MASENVQVVLELYRRLRLGEDENFPAELLDPEVEYVNPRDAIESGTRHGREEFLAAMRNIDDSFEDVSVELEEIRDAGEDEVLVLLTFVVRGGAVGW